MTKFAHITDCHLGGWRQPELQQLNLEHFQHAINQSIEEEVDFILFTGDLFDSAFPPIDTLKETFYEFKKLKEAKIKSYVIAGSHDYSITGKTFLDVLERAGFCELAKYDETEQEVILHPLKHETIHIYGYPGKKSGLEVPSIRKLKIKEPYDNHFRILMLHTTLKEVAGNIPIDSIPIAELPEADYYAMGHIHIDYELDNNNKPVIYGGPTFPNNFKELEDLKQGCFYIIEIGGYTKVTKKLIKIKEILPINIEITNAVEANELIIKNLNTHDLKDKIILLRVHGTITEGKPSDLNFHQIQSHVKEKGAFSFLKNTSKLETAKQELDLITEEKEVEKVEELIIKKYESNNPSDFNKLIFQLMDVLSTEKQEDEKSMIFEERLLSALGKTLGVELN
jgi:DNA repair exonuclease SbcCD nuclease subunit